MNSMKYQYERHGPFPHDPIMEVAPRVATQVGESVAPKPTTVQGGANDGAPGIAPQTNPPAATTANPAPPNPKLTESDRDTKEKQNVAWRGGPDNATTFTPRPGKDDVNGSGLSLFRDPAAAANGPGDKAQQLDLNKIDQSHFNVVEGSNGHVSIIPKTQKELEDWAKSRPTAKENPHPLTQKVRSSQTGVEYRNGQTTPPPKPPPSREWGTNRYDT